MYNTPENTIKKYADLVGQTGLISLFITLYIKKRTKLRCTKMGMLLVE
jgi:hypothetical protein